CNANPNPNPNHLNPLTTLFNIRHPVLLAGMDAAAGPELAAAVTNAGGMGVIGGYGFTPGGLREQIRALKAGLDDKTAPFGVDLLIPQVGGSDYTKGQLRALIEVIVDEKAALFVSAIGVPPRDVVGRLHGAGIPVMNMVGHPKHVKKALEAGVDLICAQAAEGGGHTGTIPASILIPAASTRAPERHKEHVLSAGFEDVVTTVIYSGRPMRVKRTPYVEDWNTNRQKEIEELTARGILPHWHEVEKHPEKAVEGARWPLGSVLLCVVD
ncbi:hypothetical protein B0H12DRAFT_1113406, partial [Mycena haematopus]